MPLAPWVETTPTTCAFTTTIHVLSNTQNMSALPTKYSSHVSLAQGPCSRRMIFKLIVAADTGVELVAAKVLDGDDIEG